MAKTNLTEITVWYQTILKVAGDQPHLVVDGKFGSSTSKALECFQLISRLQPSGILDVPTNVALNQVAMEWVYRKLILTPLGKMTDELRNALKRFQSHYGLEADAKVGPATRNVMVRVLRTELPTPLRHYHAHLGQGRPAGTQEPANFGLEAATAGRISGIHGNDDRVPSATTIDRPFRWVCLVNPSYDTSEFGWGSGLLISPQHVLTAAHVIADDVDDGNGGRRRQTARVSVFPGHDGRAMAERPDGMKPFGVWMGPGRDTPECYQDSCNKSCDYALIELEKPIGKSVFELRLRTEDGKGKVAKKIRLGYWGDLPGFEIRAVTPTDLAGVKLSSAGYPHDFGKRQIRATGVGIENEIMKIRRRMPEGCFQHIVGNSIDAVHGQSGSPVWRHVEENGKSVCQLVGVITSVDREVNYAVAMTEEVLKQIADWAPNTFEYKDHRLSVKK